MKLDEHGFPIPEGFDNEPTGPSPVFSKGNLLVAVLLGVVAVGAYLAIEFGPRVVALAKQDLSAGTKIDGIGGAACFGQVDTIAGSDGLLPIGISEHATLRKAVRRGDPIELGNVTIDENAYIVRLRAEQDRLIHDGDGAVS